MSKTLDVPVYLVFANEGYTRFVVKKPKSQDELKFDGRGFYEFMQDFEVPSTRFDQLY